MEELLVLCPNPIPQLDFELQFMERALRVHTNIVRRVHSTGGVQYRDRQLVSLHQRVAVAGHSGDGGDARVLWILEMDKPLFNSRQNRMIRKSGSEYQSVRG